MTRFPSTMLPQSAEPKDIQAAILDLLDKINRLADAVDALEEDIGTSTRQPGWHKVANPGTGWFASKTTGWTADRFSAATGGLEVDFSAVVPVGTRAVRVVVANSITLGEIYWRKGGDANISNTPAATGERSHQIGTYVSEDRTQAVVWLSATYTVDFAVTDTGQDVYIAYPMEYLL